MCLKSRFPAPGFVCRNINILYVRTRIIFIYVYVGRKIEKRIYTYTRYAFCIAYRAAASPSHVTLYPPQILSKTPLNDTRTNITLNVNVLILILIVQYRNVVFVEAFWNSTINSREGT